MDFARDGVRATFDSGWYSGMKEALSPTGPRRTRNTRSRTWDGFGLGDRLADRYAETLRWSPAAGRWMSWQSGCWELDDKEAGAWMARPMIESLIDEEEQYSDDPSVDEDGEPVTAPGRCSGSGLGAAAIPPPWARLPRWPRPTR